MATNEQTMAWMMDTYSMQKGHAVPEIVTGKPISIGGSVFRHEATGARGRDDGRPRLRAARLEARATSGASCRASATWEESPRSSSRERGATVMAVSDVSGGVYDPAGLDIATMSAVRAATRLARGLATGARISNEELLELECDILVLAARENQVTLENAARLQCKLIAEGANGPISLEADAILSERGIPILPDVLTNAGGVTVSYFEWVQDLQSFFWSEEQVNAKLRTVMETSYQRVDDMATRCKCDLRTAALMEGVSIIARSYELRGLYP